MDTKFIDRIIKSTLAATAIFFPFLALYIGIDFALAVLFGAIWSCLNLWGIKIVVTSLISTGPRRLFLGLGVLFFKLPILYGAGYLLLRWQYLSVGGLLIGFSAIFVVALLKALSRSVLNLNKRVIAGESKT